MNKQTVALILLIFLCGSGSISYALEEIPAAKLQTKTEAVPLHVEPPIYPHRALSQGMEGWVIVGFVISPEGVPEDVSILDASNSGYFEEAAIHAAEQTRYTPAMLNGSPVTQARNTVRMTFVIHSPPNDVSRSFHSAYRKANKALEKDDLEAVKQIMDKLDSLTQRLLSEVCFLDILKGNYWKKMGDLPLAFQHYERALVIAKENVPKQSYIGLLEQGILFALSQTDYAPAFKYYDTLLEEYPEYPTDGALSNHVMAAKAFIASDAPYPVDGLITEPCPTCEVLEPNWYHDLLRDRFTVQEVNGQIKEIKILCGFKFVSLEYVPDTTWSLDEEWGDCALQVLGDEGTSFKLVEL